MGFVLHLLFESFTARRDAQIRLLRTENQILRNRIESARLTLFPEERARFLKIGSELNHHVKQLITVVQFRTYRRWLKEKETGKNVGQVEQPRTITKGAHQAIIRFTKENAKWGYLRIVGELLKIQQKAG